MALVKHISLQKSSAIYGRNGRYTYYLELDEEVPTIFTACVTRCKTEKTGWTLSVINRDMKLVLKHDFLTKKNALTYLSCYFDSADHLEQIEWK